MANPNWKSGGPSPNPNGRPLKNRALTEILAKAGSRTVEYDGKRISGKRLMARLVWDVVVTGEAVLPDGKVLKVSPKDWLETVRWLYSHIDGPPKQQVDLTSMGEQIAFREVVAVLPSEATGE